MRDGIKFFTYPLLDRFGLKINMFVINDPVVARDVMNKNELIHGHEEMFGWWDLLAQYRKLVKGKKSDIFNSTERGLMSQGLKKQRFRALLLRLLLHNLL